jgi:uncharacterized membrane protein YedE/YeeE
VSRAHKLGLSALGAGALFGVGLAVSGMTLPSKVVGFLDFAGAWDPTLLFVMGGAITVDVLVRVLARRRDAPLFDEVFRLPTRKDVDAKLLAGAAIFGAGWGWGGYCPGPAVASIASGTIEVVAFVLAMLFAMWIVGRVEERAARRARRSSAEDMAR